MRTPAKSSSPDAGVFRREAAYTIAEVSRFVGVSASTVRAWFFGQGQFRAVFAPARFKGEVRLSFLNLVEANALGAIRRRHRVSLQKARKAVDFLRREFESKHPLAEHRFETDGIDLFVQRAGVTVSVSEGGQSVLRELVAPYLRRVEWDETGPVRFFPLTRHTEPGSVDLELPRAIVIDPRQGGGQPVVRGRGILASVIANRFKAGESMGDLAEDYGCTIEEINEAIRAHLAPAA